MSGFGFCGPSYTSQSRNAADDQAINWYCETIEIPGGKSQMAMYPSPGLANFATGLNGPPRGIFSFNGRCFTVAGGHFYEVKANTTTVDYGPISRDTNPAYFAGGPGQILFCTAGVAYVFDLKANTLNPVDATTLVGAVSQVAYSDGFFLALFQNSGQFQYSTPDDATSWDLTNTAIVSVFPDNVQGFVVNYREPIFFGSKQSQAYYDSGNLFTFDVDPSGFIEQGCIAGNSIAKLDNGAFWLGGDSRGAGIVWRLNGFSPVRVSNHAVEFAFQGYSKISDAIAYTFQDQGHSFYHIYFPTANKSWRLDVENGYWHEVGFWNGQSFDAHRSQCHAFAFGQHLVGDWKTGTIYSMAITNLTDFGNNIRRLRRAPHISTEQEWIFHSQLQVDLESGLGPVPPLLDGNGNPRDPQAMLRWSDDGGHTWSNYYSVGCGKAGEFRKRVIWRRLGRSRDRVYEFVVDDPIPWRIVDAYLKADPGFQTQERYAKQVLKVS